MIYSELKYFPTVTTVTTANDYYPSYLISSNFRKQNLDNINPEITKIEILVPNKVLRFTFKYGTQIKTVCNAEDIFDFDFAIYLAYAKLLHSNTRTREGIEFEAHRMKYFKLWARKVKAAKKLFKEQEAERIKKEKEEKERAAVRKRQAEKKARKKKERKERELKALAKKIKNVE